jgi:hypothetical protein
MHRGRCAGVLLGVLSIGIGLYAQTPSATGVDKVYLGFLDDAREEMVNWKAGVAHQRLIRPAFERNRSGWQSVTSSSVPLLMKWTIAFDGKNIGQVESQSDPNAESKQGDSEPLTVVQTILAIGTTVPTVGAPSQDFAGIMAIGPTKVRRPLVVVSKPYYADPDGWKRATRLPDEIAALVRSAFRHDFPHVDRCENEEVVERDWKFPDSSMDISVAYASNKRSFLVEARLKAGMCGFVDDPDDPLSNPWFFVSQEGSVRRIGSFMSLLDAGDYDNDGRSELVFFLSQPEDTDGFVLFDASLQKQVNLTWHYH